MKAKVCDTLTDTRKINRGPRHKVQSLRSRPRCSGVLVRVDDLEGSGRSPKRNENIKQMDRHSKTRRNF